MTYLFFVLISLLIDLRFVLLAAALVALVVWALRYREPLRISLALGAVLLTALAFHHEIGRWVASAPWSTPSNYEPRSAYRSDEEEYRAHDNSNRRRPTMSMTVRICLPRPEERLGSPRHLDCRQWTQRNRLEASRHDTARSTHFAVAIRPSTSFVDRCNRGSVQKLGVFRQPLENTH